MPTSTLISYALLSSQYTWDSFTGILFSANLLGFFAGVMIIACVISLVIVTIKSVF